MGELEDKLIEALARAMAAEKIADRALSLAQEAILKVESMKAQSPSYAIPNYDTAPLGMGDEGDLGQLAGQPVLDGELSGPPDRAQPIRISPFSMQEIIPSLRSKEEPNT